MAGVQIPQVDRFQPVDTPSIGRAEINVPNGQPMVAATANAIGSVINEADDYFTKVENHTINVKSTEAGLQYEAKLKSEAAKLKNIQGDPTKAYADFDEKTKEWQQEILDGQDNLSPKLERAIRERLAKVDMMQSAHRAVSQQIQFGKYRTAVRDGDVKLGQDGMLDAIDGVDVKDPKTFIPLKLQANRVQDAILDHAEATGLATKEVDENGVVHYKNIAPQTMELIKQRQSEGIRNVVATLNNTGKVDEAKKIMEDYNDVLTAPIKTKLMNDHKDAIVKNQAYAEVAKVDGLSPDDQMARLDKLPEGDVKQKAKSILATNIRQDEQAKEIAGKQTFETASQYLRDKGFSTIDQMKNDPRVANWISSGRMNQKQIDALEEQVVAPKHSDPKVMGKLYDKMSDGSLSNMSYGELQDALAGASQKDRDKVTKRWEDGRSQTGAEKRQMTSYMGTRLKSEMQSAGVIGKNQFGKYTNDDEIKYTRAYDQMLDAIDTYKPGISQTEQNKYVQQFVIDMVKKQEFKGAQTDKIKSAPPSVAPVLSATPNPKAVEDAAKTEQHAPTDLKYWAQQFYKVNHRAFGTDPKDNIQEFIKSQGGK